MKVGDVLGKYRIIALISEGGMGEVYLAAAPGPLDSERLVAIKVVREGDDIDRPYFERMFLEEAKIALHLRHANLVQVYDFGVDNGVPYLCLELVQGKNLRQITHQCHADRGSRLGVRFSIRIAQQVAEGLEVAHRLVGEDGRPLGLVHRDVSPQNILVSFDGAVKLTDFGIARVRDSSHPTKAGVVKGKISYLAPEQLVTGRIDRRTDVFALGIVLWEALVGQKVFPDNLAGRQTASGREIVPPSSWNPDVPTDLDRVVLRALSSLIPPGDSQRPAISVKRSRRWRQRTTFSRGHWNSAAKCAGSSPRTCRSRRSTCAASAARTSSCPLQSRSRSRRPRRWIARMVVR